MLLPLGAAAIVTVALLWDLALPYVRTGLVRLDAALRAHRRARRAAAPISRDPGRELRAEQRARALLRSCVNEEEWAMYRDLGFLRVWASGRAAHGDPPYAYLLYPHLPIVAYVPQTGALLNEYCVAFPDDGRTDGDGRLPDADDVLAKWMALTAEESRLIAEANMHLPGHQVATRQVHDDLARLGRWERERLVCREPAARPGRAVRTAGGSNSVRAA
jgi:hypothetical protein